MITSDALSSPDIAHGFFTRQGGHSTGIFSSLNCGMGSGDDKELVQRNRAVVAGELGVEPSRLLTAYQVHSPDALVVSGPWESDERPRVDALVTREPGVAIGVLTADCGPLLFARHLVGRWFLHRQTLMVCPRPNPHSSSKVIFVVVLMTFCRDKWGLRQNRPVSEIL